MVNPNGLKAQIEGKVTHGASRALFEEVKLGSSGITSVDWETYPVITFRNIPDDEIVLLDHPDKPASGAAEPPFVRVRPRTVPISQQENDSNDLPFLPL
jgi:nicotinate dehydrogenase subunit B